MRKGLVASLMDDRELHVIAVEDGESNGVKADIAVGSAEALRRHDYGCPVVVCSDDHESASALDGLPDVAGVLHRERATAAQLRAIVRAAAAGLRVEPVLNGDQPPPLVDARAKRLLELMADGWSTREIAAEMGYSERTIKKLITGLQDQLAARNRIQIVAQAIRRGLI